jgi:hypothetical protein
MPFLSPKGNIGTLQKQSKLNESGFAFGLCTDHEKNSAIVFNEYECYELEKFWQYNLITKKFVHLYGDTAIN